jgi:hypothetical protein
MEQMKFAPLWDCLTLLTNNRPGFEGLRQTNTLACLSIGVSCELLFDRDKSVARRVTTNLCHAPFNTTDVATISLFLCASKIRSDAVDKIPNLHCIRKSFRGRYHNTSFSL